MERFQRLDAIAVPIARPNVDTDQITPARFLHKPRSDNHGNYLFHDVRRLPDGTQDPDFVLNRPAYADARIIVAERNFACGSSRENAVWGLYDYGFRAAIAPSFGDIFAANGLKNGLLPVRLPEEVVAGLIETLQAEPGASVAIDLEAQTVTLPDGTVHPFEIDPFSRHCLLNGVDELEYTRELAPEIDAFMNRYGRENR
ncbi:3-isopropylmalate/(R)-2-methylmalate dehydratase small subunit [Stella humosa]|uniref:3-isopropylmalate dehydratase small subunit n=1 Tax=Stella humosa TaxID=94 RepID=A0A3N1KZ08_9PROT|nr:3-isopropylmalate dehydratase small subunit [Stella humosa]ROP83880.1 3-isopropylmalate/(R)-2-methylmalate dehydratase small subunit [Stella humosa]BBK32858.1 3-isopropylmalate dehydratase small subunit [Stella humosa]